MLRRDTQTESKLYWPCHTDPGNTPPALLQPNPTRIPPSRHTNVTAAMWGPGTGPGENTCNIHILNTLYILYHPDILVFELTAEQTGL